MVRSLLYQWLEHPVGKEKAMKSGQSPGHDTLAMTEMAETEELDEITDPATDDEPTRRYRIFQLPTVRVPRVAELPFSDDLVIEPGSDDPTLEVELTAVDEGVTVVERPIDGQPIKRRRPSDTIPDGIYYALTNRAA